MIILLISSALIFLTKNIYKAKSNTHHFRVSSGYISNVKGGLHGFHIVKYQQLPSIYFELMATCLLNMKNSKLTSYVKSKIHITMLSCLNQDVKT